METDKKLEQIKFQRVSTDLISDLLLLPEKIYKEQNELIAINNKITNIEKEAKRWELKEMSKISNETNEDGKKVFSNSTLREAELERRKSNSDSYLEMSNKIREFFERKEEKKIKLDYLNKKNRNYRSIANYLAGN